MLDKKEHLLTCIQEECSEVIKAASKSLRFGLENGHPKSDPFLSNKRDLEIELSHIIAVAEYLEEEGCINLSNINIDKERKRKKLEKMMTASRNIGTLKTE